MWVSFQDLTFELDLCALFSVLDRQHFPIISNWMIIALNWHHIPAYRLGRSRDKVL